MDVLGNNISNVNTTGFKRSRVTFQDLLYQQMSGAARPNEEIGGVNPKEIGLGMSIASVDTINTQGALQTTGVMTDLAVQGNGYFVLKKGEENFYTRAGDFGLDEAGRLVNPSNGLRVQGWGARSVGGQTVLSTSGSTEDLVIPVGSKDPAKATARVDLACNLDKRTPEIPAGNPTQDTIEAGTWRVEQKIYDTFGNPHNMRIEFQKVAGQPNQWRATVAVDPDNPQATNAAVALQNPQAGQGNNFIVQFDNRGLLQRVTDAQGTQSAAVGALDIAVSFDVAGATAVGGQPARQTFRLGLGTVGSATNTVTQQAERSSTKVFEQDGYTMGYLDTFKIDQSGQVTAVYSNGSNRLIGQIALASFANPGGLEKAGSSTFVQSNNSGQANIGPSGIAGKGKIMAGTLEMSNVDLADQMTDMIVTERGFQANSKTIQTSDQMLQELLQLKR
jgi:flagellar hook protein FlgE